jgi:hypothetical protein
MSVIVTTPSPRIACQNLAKTQFAPGYLSILSALQKFVNQFFGPIWGVGGRLYDAGLPGAKPGEYSLVFLDDADQADALGYHFMTDAGMPQARIFVKTALANGEQPSVTACHEISEMLADANANTWCQANDGSFWALEVSDPVEEDTFEIDKVKMSNFVTPAFFEGFWAPGAQQVDYLKTLKAPFTIRPTGYALIAQAGQQAQAVFGSPEKAERFAKEDRRGHRTEQRISSYPVQAAKQDPTAEKA